MGVLLCCLFSGLAVVDLGCLNNRTLGKITPIFKDCLCYM